MKILVCDSLSKVGVEILKKEKGIETDVKTGLPEDEIVKIAGEYDGMIVRSATKITRKIIEAAKRLRVVGRAGIGVDNIDVEAAGKRGIIVMNAPDGNVITTAEHALALMLAMSRNIPQANVSMKKDKKWSPKNFMGVEVYGKNLGIIGMGRIGSIVAERARGFHMKILVYDPFISDERAQQLGAERVELQDLLKRADFISLHTPKVGSKPLLSKEEFDIMKPGVRIINCARGSLIDEKALIEAIKSKKVAQAALDVYDKEPIPADNPMLDIEEIICTPHLGASTEEAQEKVAVAICDQIIDYLKYGNVRNAVNMPALDGDLLAKIKPFMDLGEKMGKMTSQLIDDPLSQVNIQYAGEVSNLNVGPITTSVLMGMFSNVVEGINMVNAPFIAKERGINIQESKSNVSPDYTSTVRVEIKTKSGGRSVTGAIFGKGDPRIIKLDEFHLEALFSKFMLVLTNNDMPGVIGSLGNILGKNSINIAGFHLGRLSEKGKAVSLINIDMPPNSETLRELRQTQNVLSVHSVIL